MITKMCCVVAENAFLERSKYVVKCYMMANCLKMFTINISQFASIRWIVSDQHFTVVMSVLLLLMWCVILGLVITDGCNNYIRVLVH